MTISKALRRKIWQNEFNSKGKAKCPCCRTTNVTVWDFHVGHRVAKCKGGANRESNLRPICALCNMSMGKLDWEVFAKQFTSSKIPLQKKRKKSVKQRHKCQGLLASVCGGDTCCFTNPRQVGHAGGCFCAPYNRKYLGRGVGVRFFKKVK